MSNADMSMSLLCCRTLTYRVEQIRWEISSRRLWSWVPFFSSLLTWWKNKKK